MHFFYFVLLRLALDVATVPYPCSTLRPDHSLHRERGSTVQLRRIYRCSHFHDLFPSITRYALRPASLVLQQSRRQAPPIPENIAQKFISEPKGFV